MTDIRSVAYFGGKAPHGIVNQFVNRNLPADTKKVHYVEPFAGMGGVLLSRPRSEAETLNDADCMILNWWLCVRDCYEELSRQIKYTPHSREEFERATIRLRQASVDDFEIPDVGLARDIQVFIWQSIMHGPNFSGESRVSWGASRSGDCVAETIIAEIPKIADRIRRVQLENTCALKLLDRMSTVKEAIIYADPPYPDTHIKPYRASVDFNQLGDLFCRQEGRVAISGVVGNWCHLPESRRGPWRMEEMRVRTTAGTNSKDKSYRRECIYMNYEPAQQTMDFFSDST